MTRTLRAACLQTALGALLAGCLGVAPDEAEEGTAEITLGGLWLNVSRPSKVKTEGWPANTSSIRRTTRADSTVIKRSIPKPGGAPGEWLWFQPVDIEAPQVAFNSRDRQITLEPSYTYLSDPFRSFQGTVVGTVLWHRPAGTHHVWNPVHCGASAYAEGRAPVNLDLVGYFEGPVRIDQDARQISFRRGEEADFQTVDFASCGVRETYSEFSAMVIPTEVYLSKRFKGTFDHDLYATCNGGTCSAYEGDPADETLGKANVPFIGMGLLDIPAQFVEGLAREEGLHPGQGVFVNGVVEGGPAEQGGILFRDILVAVNGVPVNMYSLPSFVEACSPGQALAVAVLRTYENSNRIDHLGVNLVTGYQDVPGFPPQ